MCVYSVLHGLADMAKTLLLCMVNRREPDVDMYIKYKLMCLCEGGDGAVYGINWS